MVYRQHLRKRPGVQGRHARHLCRRVLDTFIAKVTALNPIGVSRGNGQQQLASATGREGATTASVAVAQFVNLAEIHALILLNLDWLWEITITVPLDLVRRSLTRCR